MHNFTFNPSQSNHTFEQRAEANTGTNSYGFRTAPSKQSVANILAYGKALEVRQMAAGKYSELLLN